MSTSFPGARAQRGAGALPLVLAVSFGLLAFCILFLLIDQTYVRLLDPRFPSVGTSHVLATAWGVVSRAPWILVIAAVAVLRPHLLALRIGGTWSNRGFVVALAFVNAAVVGAFLLLSGGGTPYGGNHWLVTEVVTVPVVEELFWRGLVFSLLVAVLQRGVGQRRSATLAVWLSGVAFGLLHAGNALTGLPLAFVALQTLNAVIWGVAYGYARARTGSVVPSLIAHAVMNLVVVAL